MLGLASLSVPRLRRGSSRLVTLTLLVACAAPPSVDHPKAGATPGATDSAPLASTTPAQTTPLSPGAAAPAATSSRSDATLAPNDPSLDGEPCGPLDCRRFATAARAFHYLLQKEPLVVGIGEAHAPPELGHIRGSARRFGEELLPTLEGRASHLIVELLSPNSDCQETTREVREAHKPVTQSQSRNNQDDYVALGHRAKALHIEPFVLTPSCDEYRAITSAGDDAIAQTLTTIATITSRMLRAALVKNQAAGQARVVLAYGGALHNDVTPQSSRAAWSYGPELSAFTGGRYLELDLIVREFIKDNDVWRALPWYEHFKPELYPDASVVMRWGPQSYVLFFPRSSPAEPATPTGR
jgi:hypothetical protein